MRRRGAGAALCLVAGASLLVAGAGPAQADGGLGGFTIAASSSPLSVLIYEQAIPIPAEPQAELHMSYASASANYGPTTRGLASALWPGAAVGDGYGTIMATLGLPSQLASILGTSYPVEANSTYPAGPNHAEQPAGASAAGPTSVSDADVKHAAATSTYATTAIPQLATVTGAKATGTATPTDQQATTDTTAQAGDVSLLGGLIDVSGITTSLNATSDGTTAAGGGTAEVGGLTVLGQRFSVDDQGVHAIGTGSVLAVLQPGLALLPALGITVDPPAVTKTVQGATATVAGHALQITVDLTSLNTFLSALPLGTLAAALPPGLPGQVAQALYAIGTAAPKIVFVVGDASAAAAASPAFDFNSPSTFAPSGPTQAVVPPGSPTSTTPPVTGTGALPTPPGTTPGSLGSQPGPVVAGTTPPAVSGQAPAPAPAASSGSLPSGKSLPAGLLVAALALAGLLGWGLRWIALAGLAGGTGCDLGAPVAVPDLRSPAAAPDLRPPAAAPPHVGKGSA